MKRVFTFLGLVILTLSGPERTCIQLLRCYNKTMNNINPCFKLPDLEPSFRTLIIGERIDPWFPWCQKVDPVPYRKDDDKDVELVMNEAQVSRDRATEALKQTDGDIVEAVVYLLDHK